MDCGDGLSCLRVSLCLRPGRRKLLCNLGRFYGPNTTNVWRYNATTNMWTKAREYSQRPRRDLLVLF